MTSDEFSASAHDEEPWLESWRGVAPEAKGEHEIRHESMARFYRRERLLGGRRAADLAAVGAPRPEGMTVAICRCRWIDSIQILVHKKAIQELGLRRRDADSLLTDMVADLLDSSNGQVVENIYPDGNPQLDHEDGMVFGACRVLAGDDPLARV
ncbi:Panacea domain-containing protein [Nocardia aurantia]|uniref:Uncharacterized protein n=1 Tax=Nocardia aurantia TaxID=2585199 RepID=A0A7K0DP48_9NOCA|nr:hypothetical protein [Nocardia aurantia]MQY27513.1 hypothetical protein [Nocardia aurantia]